MNLFTPDEILNMARQAGWTGIFSQWISPTERQHLTVPVTIEQIEAFAKLVRERERERLANKVDGLGDGDPVYTWWVAEQIRAEGDKQ